MAEVFQAELQILVPTKLHIKVQQLIPSNTQSILRNKFQSWKFFQAKLQGVLQ